MTIEQKALELWNAERAAIGCSPWTIEFVCNDTAFKALCRALEAHEADKSRHAAELREQAERFSEAVEHCRRCSDPEAWTRIKFELEPFILAPVDPLVEAIGGLWTQDNCKAEHMARGLRAALEARGLAIVKKEAV